MSHFLNTKTLSIIIIILSFIIILIFSCVLNDIKKIADDPDLNAEWDVDLKVPVVDYSTTPISLGEYVEEKALSISTPDLPIPLAQWPIDFDPPIMPINGAIPINTDVDIDGGGSDFTLEGYYTTRTDILELRIWLTDSSNTILRINSDCIDIEQVVIENINCNFGALVNQNNILVYTSANFLNPVEEYYLDFTNTGNPDELDYTIEFELNNNSPPSYTGNTYTLHFILVINLETDFSIVGRIINPAILNVDISNQDIPIGDLPVEELDKFNLEFEYSSNLPFGLNINTTFYGSDQIPSPNTFNTIIASGILSTSPIHGYFYVSDIYDSKDYFKFNDDVLDYGDMKIDLQLRLPIPNGTLIRLDTDTLIRVKVIASAEATISL